MLIPLLLTVLALANPDDVLEAELERSWQQLAEQPEAPHYMALALLDEQLIRMSATAGALSGPMENTERLLDVDLRVGTPELDSTHALRGFSSLEGGDRWRVQVPLGADADAALAHAVWREVDARYRAAAERIVMIRANQSVKVGEESPAPDFEPREPVVDCIDVPDVDLDEATWGATLQRVSERLERSDVVYVSHAALTGGRSVKRFVDSEGTRLTHGRVHYRVELAVGTTVADGDQVTVFTSRDAHDLAGLPGEDELLALADDAVTRLEALAEAPRGTPYTGPVLLSGRAAAVFFHEIFGHRVEGHRQKLEDEGKTFAALVGQPILPEFVDVYDDPRLERWGDVDLNGHYRYDDEGVAAQRVDLVADGVFQGFLMGRSPIPGFSTSNGHGRRDAGHAPTSRMGNTIVEVEGGISHAALVERLRSEVRDQGLEFGYIVDDIEGGFTQTGRVTPNAFNVRAVTSWRVYADGRPDELVRGIDLVGTPLTAFHTLVAASDEVEVFNGTCGAESGWVPVSAVAPAMLFRHLEFQLKEKGQERPPLLPKPGTDGAAEVQP